MPGDSGYTTAELSSLTMDLGTVTPPQLGSRVNAYGMVLPSGGFALAGLEILSSVTPPPGISSIAPSTATISVGNQLTFTVTTTALLADGGTVMLETASPSPIAISPSSVLIPPGEAPQHSP